MLQQDAAASTRTLPSGAPRPRCSARQKGKHDTFGSICGSGPPHNIEQFLLHSSCPIVTRRKRALCVGRRPCDGHLEKQERHVRAVLVDRRVQRCDLVLIALVWTRSLESEQYFRIGGTSASSCRTSPASPKRTAAHTLRSSRSSNSSSSSSARISASFVREQLHCQTAGLAHAQRNRAEKFASAYFSFLINSFLVAPKAHDLTARSHTAGGSSSDWWLPVTARHCQWDVDEVG